MSDAVVWKTRDPYYGLGPQGLRKRLRELLEGRVLGAWLFGSHASGSAGPDSDLDLIVVARTELPFTRRPALFDELYELFPALDLLVYTPEEFERLRADPSPGFWASVVASLERII